MGSYHFGAQGRRWRETPWLPLHWNSTSKIFFRISPIRLQPNATGSRSVLIARSKPTFISWTKLAVLSPSNRGGIFPIHPAPSRLLRNLTLCVLLVTGGTLAALPFRHNPSDSDEAVLSGEATGPTQSELGRNGLNSFVETDTTLSIENLVPDGLPKWKVPNVSSLRPQVPSSFEEIAVPLRINADDQDRLTVSATKQLRSAAKVPVTDSLAHRRTSQPQPIDLSNSASEMIANKSSSPSSFGSSFANGSTTARSVLVPNDDFVASLPIPRSGASEKNGKPNTTLASAGRTNDAGNDVTNNPIGQWEEPIERLPNPSPPDRKRYWIRQPD